MLSVCIIAQDEEECIGRVIESVPSADEIIVLDGGSIDNTMQIASSYPKVKVYENKFDGDFGKQKNLCNSYATGDWILSLDCDEYLEPEQEAKLSALIADETVDAYEVIIKTYLDGIFVGDSDPRPRRLFRRRNDIKWEKRLHEELVSPSFVLCDLVITHSKTGAMQEIDNKRYWSLGQIPDRYAIKTEKQWYRREVDNFSVPIACFHKVGYYPDSTVAVTIDEFKQWIIDKLEADYNFVLLEDIYEHRCGGKTLPQKPIVLTIDDGYICLYENVYPVLRRYKIHANAFIITDAVGKWNNWDSPPERLCQHVTWKQIDEMKSLISFQSHSVSHRNLTQIDEINIRRELNLSRTAIETSLHSPVRFFSYPYGSYDRFIKSMVIKSGYIGAVTLGNEVNNIDSEMYALTRYNMTSKDMGII